MRNFFVPVLPLVLLLPAHAAFAESGAGTPYALDVISRETPAAGRLECPEVELVTYAGTTIHFQKPAKIYVGFEDPLRRFEEIVRDTAVEVYGRAPRTLRHEGAFYCRRTRLYPTLLSEHALGNALDVAGFEFGPAPPGTDAPEGLAHAFSVSVGHDWTATRGVGAVHSRFLRLLAERVIAADLFHVVLGPSYPGHEDHFHLDFAPYRLVHVFGYDPRHSSPP